ncbi:ANK_REP_REGION domain-containing protein [Caerostris extrusa]|uniref:ANK_REP_REGION domain-containing protein n=1 Tax=Caerostris extrusa TaxID=172846 RepID=A0AAV4V5N5_CAEEX|nr:ANK_REP_REGION domain-containing protein [Caerostris extrusa]
MHLSRPDIVRLLLNCGARIPYEDACYCASDRRHPLKNVMDVMKAPMENSAHPRPLQFMVSHTERCAMSLRILLVDLSYTSPLWGNICETLGELTGEERLENIPSLKTH